MLADQIQADLTTAMKARDPLTVSVLRLAIAGIKEARVSGAQSHELTDEDVLAILAKEAKRREEAAAAFSEGGRTESAAKELPEPLSEDELSGLVDEALTEGGFDSPSQMGPAMQAAVAKVAGRADGKAVSALVKVRLAGT
jgi:uncharacterized protein YqeY